MCPNPPLDPKVDGMPSSHSRAGDHGEIVYVDEHLVTGAACVEVRRVGSSKNIRMTMP